MDERYFYEMAMYEKYMEEKRMNTDELYRQTFLTAEDYFNDAVRKIDKKFGEGYAKENPELVKGYMQVLAQDFDTALKTKTLEELRETISGINYNLEQIADELRN